MAPDVPEREDRARKAIEALARAETGRLLGALLRDVRDFQMAEDCLQEALESALLHWSRNGLPDSGAGWVLQAARRKAIDRFRRVRNFDRKAAEYGLLIELDQQTVTREEPPEIPDERLRLIFTCCHPALDSKTRVALTLRTLCGLTTREIARAFLDATETMAQRLVRARHKITKAGIPFAIPEPEHWAERLNSVLSVIYLIFNEGYTATAGPELLRQDLCLEAIRLGRLMLELAPGDAECEGLLALMLLNHSHARARIDDQGRMIPLDQQDRSLWRNGEIEEGSRILERRSHADAQACFNCRRPSVRCMPRPRATRRRTGNRSCFCTRPCMRDRTIRSTCSTAPRHCPMRMARTRRWTLLAQSKPALDGYQPFHAAKADLLRRTGQFEAARQSYRRAIALSGNESERQFLASRMAAMDQST
jgi:RNA polymerase sigma-70 factor (ECF subfamily)